MECSSNKEIEHSKTYRIEVMKIVWGNLRLLYGRGPGLINELGSWIA